MNKKLFGAMAVAVVLFAGYNVYESSTEMKLSDLALANIEALANDSENSANSKTCYNTIVPLSDASGLGVWVYDCDNCSKRVKVSKAENQSNC